MLHLPQTFYKAFCNLAYFFEIILRLAAKNSFAVLNVPHHLIGLRAKVMQIPQLEHKSLASIMGRLFEEMLGAKKREFRVFTFLCPRNSDGYGQYFVCKAHVEP